MKGILYPKIQTLYKRGEKGEILINEEYTLPEISLIDKWEVAEKIDGTNIRIGYDPRKQTIRFGGKTENADIKAKLMNWMNEIFTFDKMEKQFPLDEEDTEEWTVTLFGEGFGAGIHKGGNYQPVQEFILFDVKIGKWWLLRDSLVDIAKGLGIEVVPFLGYMSVDEIISYVYSKPKSMIASNKDYIMEGIVARTDPLLLRRDGSPLKWKLKARDFKNIKLEKKVK